MSGSARSPAGARRRISGTSYTTKRWRQQLVSDTQRGTNVREEDLSEDIVQEDELDIGGQVGVNPIFAEELVVLNVIPLLYSHSSVDISKQKHKQNTP